MKVWVINIIRIDYVRVRIILLVFLCIFTPLGTGLVQAATNARVSLAWDPSPEPDVAGYKVYFGRVSQLQMEAVDVGNENSYTLMGLLEGTTYYFAATAYNLRGQESVFSNEVSTTTPICAYAIAPTSRSFTASGGSSSAAVTATAGCSWTASKAVSWITVTSGASGTGNGTVGYSVAANTGSARSASITVAGRTLTISQAAGSVLATFKITTSVSSGGTISPSGAVSVQSGASCTFTVSPVSGYQIATIFVDGASKGAVSSFTFTNVISNHTIDATFNPL